MDPGKAILKLTALGAALLATLSIGAGTAGAVVVDMNAVGQPSATYNPGNQSGYYGVSLVPSTGGQLQAAHVPPVVTGAPCLDPALPPDLLLPNDGLCDHGGPVMHGNQTFALTWDPLRRYFQTTRNYVEQFLRDVADGSGTFSSPYAVTPQYTDANGRAGNNSIFGGGCIDYGAVGGTACHLGNTSSTGPGYDYPANGCTVSGIDDFYENPDGSFGSAANDTCLTDAQIQAEVVRAASQNGLLARTQSGFTPLMVVLTPPGVEVCLDSGGSICSVNGNAPAGLCSYHSQVQVGGSEIPYMVQPWTAGFPDNSACDEPDAPQYTPTMTTIQFATFIGARLVSPLSQGQMAAITNPHLNGWFGLDGSEINDNGCVPFGNKLDTAIVGSSGQNPYFLRREFNNAGVIETDPNALKCQPSVALQPEFVVPSSVSPGDIVQFDGSTTVSSLIVPDAGYAWDFGDGTGATGPSVEHTYAAAGKYTVKLTVTDRGGNVARLTQTVAVLGPTGPPPPPRTGGHGPKPVVRLALLPQGLKAMLRYGLAMRLTTSAPAAGIVSVLISRQAARRAGLRVGRLPAVVVGRGTVSGISAGTVRLYLHLARGVAAKLAPLHRLTVTVRLALVAKGGRHVTIDVAGRY
jgi:PKD domain